MRKAGRAPSMKTVNWKIEKTKRILEKIDARKDKLTSSLRILLEQRDEIRKREIMDAITKSRRSYEEILNFIRA